MPHEQFRDDLRRLSIAETPDLLRPITAYEDERITAFHEAGHVVMCLIHSIIPTTATVVRHSRANTEVLGAVYYRKEERWTANWAPNVDISLAGMVAEARFYVHPHAPASWGPDRLNAAAAAKLLKGNSTALGERYVTAKFAEIEARFRQAPVWDATVLVSLALLKHKTLVGAEMLETCRAAVRLIDPDAAPHIWRWPGYAKHARLAYGRRLGPELAAAVKGEMRYHIVLVVGAVLWLVVSWS